MLTSSTSTSSSSWKCLKVNIRTTIVVASVVSHPDIFVSSITSSFHHYSSSHLVKLMCQQAPFPSNQKKIGCWEVSISHLGSFLHFKEGYLHLDIYFLGTQATRKKARFSRRLSSTVGLAKRGENGWWSKPGVHSGEQHLNAGGNRMIEKSWGH